MSRLTDDEVRGLTCDCAESMTGMDQCPYHGGNDEMWVDVPARAIQLRVEAIIDARVAAERERLLARIEEYVDLLCEQGDEHVPGCTGQADCAACVAADLRALIAEERAR